MSIHQHGYGLTVLLTNEYNECPICALEETKRGLMLEIQRLSGMLEAERDISKRLTKEVNRLRRAYNWMSKRYKIMTGR